MIRRNSLAPVYPSELQEFGAERQKRLVAWVVKDSSGAAFDDCRKLPADVFSDAQCYAAWRTIIAAASHEQAVLSPHCCEFWAHPTCGVEYVGDRGAAFVAAFALFGHEQLEMYAQIVPSPGAKALLERMGTRRFDNQNPPSEPVPRFLINGKPVSTPGNLTNLIAQAKAGKSAVVGAMIAAVMCADAGINGRDTLGVTASAPGPRRLIHIDTEQSPHDHYQLVCRSLRRAGTEEPPQWLDSYGLAGYTPAELRQALRVSLEKAAASGGTLAVIIDGVADLVADVNDATESNALVAELHALAIKYDCSIVNVVHENPGPHGNGKMRGHLGSQLERKAESNIRLLKKGEVSTIFSDKMRRAPISEDDGPRFAWSDCSSMHVSERTLEAEKQAMDHAELTSWARKVWSEDDRLAPGEVYPRIQQVAGVQRRQAQTIFATMKQTGIIKKRGSCWNLAA